MRSIRIRLAKYRHYTLIQSKRKQQIAISLQLPLHLNAISTRAFILQKSAGKKMVLFAIFGALMLLTFCKNWSWGLEHNLFWIQIEEHFWETRFYVFI